MPFQPYEFNLTQFSEEFDYLVVNIDFGKAITCRCTCWYSVTGVEGYPKIYEIVEGDGWIKYADKKDNDCAGRYRHFFKRRKSELSEE